MFVMSKGVLVNIGDSITTAQSGVTGTVVEIVPDPKGQPFVRVRLDNGKWTTIHV